MVIYEQIYEFERLLATISKGFTTVEKPDTDTILLAMNIAQTRFVFTKYLNEGTTTKTVEHLRKKADDLRNIIQPSEQLTATAINSGPYNGIGYTIPITSTSTPYLFYLRSDSYVSRVTALPTSGYIWTPNNLADSIADLDNVTTNLFNKPILRQPIVALQSNGILLLTDSYTTVNSTGGFSMSYLRQPKYLGFVDNATTTTTCELASHTHEELTRFAVDIYTKEYKFLLAGMGGKKQETNAE